MHSKSCLEGNYQAIASLRSSRLRRSLLNSGDTRPPFIHSFIHSELIAWSCFAQQVTELHVFADTRKINGRLARFVPHCCACTARQEVGHRVVKTRILRRDACVCDTHGGTGSHCRAA
eukprot:1068063-Prymnesium_polylepis.2